MDVPADWLNPTPEQMLAALLDAARGERWNHWEHEVEKHAGDWVKSGDARRIFAPGEFRTIPRSVARYQFVELCAYRYNRRIVRGFYCKRLPFQGLMLMQTLVVLDPGNGEIIHCMRPDKGKAYCRRRGRQENLFVPIRW